MTDLLKEDLVELKDVPHLLPGRRLTFSSVYRWAHPGPKRGQPLEVVRLGARLFTSKQALARFAAASTAADPYIGTQSKATKPRTAAKRAKAIKLAEGRLAESGI